MSIVQNFLNFFASKVSCHLPWLYYRCTAHLAAREGHLMSLKYLLCTHGNIVEAIYEKNNMVLYSTVVFSGLPLVMCIM